MRISKYNIDIIIENDLKLSIAVDYDNNQICYVEKQDNIDVITNKIDEILIKCRL